MNQPLKRQVVSAVQLVVTLLLVSVAGCQSEKSSKLPSSHFIDPSIETTHSLGWLGAESHPLLESVTIPDGDSHEVTPGGIVLCEIHDNGVAAASKLQVGDVLVQVAEDWLPNREDPTLDLIEACEQQLAAGNQEFSVAVLRNGVLESFTIRAEFGSLDEGLPLSVDRYDVACSQGLTHLMSLQADDGSFQVAESDNLAAKMRVTSLAGLAFMAGGARMDGSPFGPSFDACLRFVADQIDARTTPATPSPVSISTVETVHIVPNGDKPTGDDGDLPLAAIEAAIQAAKDSDSNRPLLAASTVDIDPLTAAYVLQFLSESEIPLLDRAWIVRMASLMGTLSKSQSKDGGWLTSSRDESANEDGDSGESKIDASGTYVTNQVLLALGMMERKGMLADSDSIEKACGYLKQQAAARVSNALDRRTKAVLACGTGAALLATNCDRGDSFLQELAKENLSRANEILRSPQFGMPGLLSSALFSRQQGNQAWMQFLNAVRYELISLQRPNGSFAEIPRLRSDPHPLESSCDGAAWRAAHYCLVLGLQGENLDKLTARTQTPMMVTRDSSGKASQGLAKRALPGGIPAGAQVIMLDGADMDEIKEKLREKMKELGEEIDFDNIETQVIEIGSEE